MLVVSELLQASGNIIERPFAEVLAEASSLEFDGSFRLSRAERQGVIYLRKGKIVFASSNERVNRLFLILLERGKLRKEDIAILPSVTNDLELARLLLSKNLLSKSELDEAFRLQTERSVSGFLNWQEGEWTFTTLARAKEDVNYEVDPRRILLNYARNIPLEKINASFISFQERFFPKADLPEIELLPAEAYVLSRFENSGLTFEELFLVCGMPEAQVLRIVYTLWLCGLLSRENYKQVFSNSQIEAILSARLRPLQREVIQTTSLVESLEKAETTEKDEEEKLEEYLNRVENAEDFYKVLNVDSKSTTDEIKKAYFSLAKRFHPDRFHKEKGTELHERIQKAFSQIARAYETLKDEKLRRAYDLKIRSKAVKEETTRSPAEEAFNQGYELIIKEKYVEALPLIARAAFLEPSNARYRAFYGKLLSLDERHKFKAESELQEAIRLEPRNVEYRIMLAEFYVSYGLLRRAEAELRRLLEISPNNQEALRMLRELSKNNK